MGVIMDPQLSHRLDALQGELDQHLWAMEHRINRRLDRIDMAQADIDAATQAILTATGVIETDDDNLNTAVQAIQAYILAHPDDDVSQLNAAVAAIGTTTDALTAAVGGAQGVVPQPPAPPANS
jgi:hypothetical protein